MVEMLPGCEQIDECFQEPNLLGLLYNACVILDSKKKEGEETFDLNKLTGCYGTKGNAMAEHQKSDSLEQLIELFANADVKVPGGCCAQEFKDGDSNVLSFIFQVFLTLPQSQPNFAGCAQLVMRFDPELKSKGSKKKILDALLHEYSVHQFVGVQIDGKIFRPGQVTSNDPFVVNVFRWNGTTVELEEMKGVLPESDVIEAQDNLRPNWCISNEDGTLEQISIEKQKIIEESWLHGCCELKFKDAIVMISKTGPDGSPIDEATPPKVGEHIMLPEVHTVTFQIEDTRHPMGYGTLDGTPIQRCFLKL